MKSLLIPLVAGSLLFLISPSVFAAQGGTPAPPGTYTDQPLNPNQTPVAPYGNDLVLEENVPGATTQPPNTVPPGGTAEKYNAVKVIVELTVSESSATNPSPTSNGNSTCLQTLALITQVANITGPTGTYAAGTIGVGKQTYNTLAFVKHNYNTGVSYYQYKFTVTWQQDSPTTPGTVIQYTEPAYAMIGNYPNY